MSVPAHVLGTTDELMELSRSEELRDIALSLATQARRTVDIVSRHFDPAVFDTEAFYNALRDLVVDSRRAQVRVLLLDPSPLVARGHRLIELSQRLSSFMAIRVPGPEHKEFNEAWLVADNTGYVHRRFSDRFEGTANFADRRWSTHLTNRFEELWQRAQPDPNLRRLHL